MNSLYSLRGVTRVYGSGKSSRGGGCGPAGGGPREVLNIASLDIETGETYALLGANGAGKTTLMRLLAFLDAPSAGEIIFQGKRVEKGQEARFRPGVVWVPQFPVLFTGSLLYNVEYPMALKKIPAAQRRKRALELLESVGLEKLALTPAPGLSGGEAQRASVARALAAGAKVLLFDEPTANVDERSLGVFSRLVKEIWEREKLSIFITTHNAALAADLCRKQIHLQDGRVVRRHLLPGDITAWPATLAKGAEALPQQGGRSDENTLVLMLDAETAAGVLGQDGAACETPGRPRSCGSFPLRGVFACAAGVAIRLEPEPGRTVDFLIRGAHGEALAETLTLGMRLAVYAGHGADAAAHSQVEGEIHAG